MHHSGKSDGSQAGQLDLIGVFHIFRKFVVAVLQPFPNLLQTVGPDTVFQTILPFMVARCNGIMVFVDQHRLDPGRTEFDPQYPAPLLNTGNDFFLFRHIRILLIPGISIPIFRYFVCF